MAAKRGKRKGPAKVGPEPSSFDAALAQVKEQRRARQERCDECVRQILSEMKAREKPPIVYHYTTKQGLLGIVRDDKIWATHSRYLNDVRELRHVESVLRGVIYRLVEKTKASAEVLWQLNEMADPEKTFDWSDHVFVASFSTDPDVLSQWRAYAGDGTGYGLGIATDSTFTVGSSPLELLPVEYNRTTQTKMVERIVDVALEGRDLSTVKEVRDLWSICTAALGPIAPLLKNEGFREECEWRLTVPCAKTPLSLHEFRPSSFGVTPYVNVSCGDERLPIRKVRLGPQLTDPACFDSVRLLLERYRVDFDTEEGLLRSITPYRNRS